jgi:large subunit ribosomal protein L29
MKAQYYREMNPDELQHELDELQKKKFELRSQAVTENLENCRAISNVKKDIARIKTVIREQSIGNTDAAKE